MLLAEAQSRESKDSEHESYNVFIALSISLGSQDTAIEEGKVDNLAIGAATMPAPKPVRKKSPVPSAAPITATAAAKKIEAVSTTELASAFGNLSVQALSPFFDYQCPMFLTITSGKTSTSSGLMCMLLLCIKIFSAMQEFCLEVKSWHGSLAFQCGGLMRTPSKSR